MADGSVQGFTQERHAPVRAAFEANLASGADVGASFCATLEGETVVDLWGGFADAAKTKPWEKDTLANVYSTTKTMTFLTALLLADRGELDFDAPVARYWPEFAANGKADIKVSHLMAHSAGLSGWRETVSTEDLYDWEKVCALLAAQAPLWEPGTASGYHAITQGYLVGEVVRRITGKSLGTVFREEIAQPLGADFSIGLPAGRRPRRRADPAAQGARASARSRRPRSRRSASTTRWSTSRSPPRGPGAAPRSPPPAARAMRARWPRSTPSSPTAAFAKGKRLMSEAGCRKVRWNCRSRVLTWSSAWMPLHLRHGLLNARGRPRSPCRIRKAACTGAATAARSS